MILFYQVFLYDFLNLLFNKEYKKHYQILVISDFTYNTGL